MRRLRAALLGAVVAVLLAGCATIPTAGPVEQPSPQAVPSDDPDVIVVPNAPPPGARPDEIVRGFITAASGGGDYTVAKQFLTSQMAAAWKPNARVYVHQQGWSTTGLSGDRVRLEVPTTGEVDGDGAFRPTGSTRTLDFALQQVQGQWRISKAPNGVVLTETAFQRVFQAVALKFYDPTFRRFVPDVRWLPRADLAAAVVTDVIAGPSAPLGGGVVATAFPADTALAQPVQSADGIASIVLKTAAEPSRQAIGRMQQQIAASLPSSLAVRLTVNGVLAPTAPESGVEQPAVTADPAVLVGNRFGSLSATRGFIEDKGLGARIAAEKPAQVTESTRQRLAAVLTTGGQVTIVTATAAPRVVDRRDGLIAPTLDQSGWVYSVPSDDPGGLQAASASHATPVGISGLTSGIAATAVLSIEVSWDGTRMLVLVATDRGPVAYVAGIERDAQGTPIALTSDRYPIDLSGSPGASDATWVDPFTVGVLTTSTDAQTQTVVSQQLGGFATSLGPLSNAREVVGGSRPEELTALGTSGALQVWSGTAWRAQTADAVPVQVLAVQR